MKKLVSILLAAALVLTAPAAALAAPAYDVTVTDVFSYDGGDGLEFHVPRIEYEGEGIQAVNDAIWADLYEDQLYSEYGAMTAIEEGWSPEPYRVTYKWDVSGDVLSLLTMSFYSNDYVVYGVYNVSLSVGRQITDSELLSALGVDEDQFLLFAQTALVQEFEAQFGAFPDDEFKQAQRQSNQSEDNARRVRPYLDGAGDLCGIGRVYSLAGAGEYAHELTLLDRGEDAPAVSTADLPETAPVDGRLADFINGCDSRYFTRADIAGFDEQMCLYARNGVYAKLGWIFESAHLREYFSRFDWYTPTLEPSQFTADMLNDCQRANVDLVLAYEAEMGY